MFNDRPTTLTCIKSYGHIVLPNLGNLYEFSTFAATDFPPKITKLKVMSLRESEVARVPRILRFLYLGIWNSEFHDFPVHLQLLQHLHIQDAAYFVDIRLLPANLKSFCIGSAASRLILSGTFPRTNWGFV